MCVPHVCACECVCVRACASAVCDVYQHWPVPWLVVPRKKECKQGRGLRVYVYMM